VATETTTLFSIVNPALVNASICSVATKEPTSNESTNSAAA